MGEAVVAAPPRRRTLLPIVLAAGLMAIACLMTVRQASVVIDGQRYYYLDDDQMISMRYARNLVDGMGLVWNPGEHVEGYTNLGWVLVMAAVHAVGVPERLTSLAVEVINIGLAVVVLVLADRLLARLVHAPPWLRLIGLLTLGLSIDLVYWVINGFETTLLTALFLWALVRAVDDADRGELSPWTCLIAGLLPVVRSDAVDLTAIVVLVAVALGGRRRYWAIGLAAAPLAAHLAFRVAYYGDWLPNTYYLKVAGRAGLFTSGLGYLKGFFAAYPALIVLAVGAAITAADRRLRVILASMALVPLHVMAIGQDMFQHHRFLAPVLPVLIVAGVSGIAVVTDRRAAKMLAVVLFVSTVMVSGINGPKSLILASNNGVMEQSAVAGVLISRNTRPETTLLVAAAGTVGYFSHRTAFDMLGKVDREIGHLPPRSAGFVGHDHYDVDRSLAHSPDIVVSIVSNSRAQQAADPASALNLTSREYRFSDALLTNASFVRRYLPHPIPIPYLLKWNALFVRDDSPEIAGMGRWPVPVLEVE
jgi:hypothetical protein